MAAFGETPRPCASTGWAGRARKCVAGMRHFAAPLRSAAKAELLHLAVQRRAGHSSSFAALETLPPARASARCSTARSAASMSSSSARARPMISAAGRGREGLGVDSKSQPSGASRPDHEVVPVDRKQRGPGALAAGRRNAGPGKGEAKILRLYCAGRVRDRGATMREALVRDGTRRRRAPRRVLRARQRWAQSCKTEPNSERRNAGRGRWSERADQ